MNRYVYVPSPLELRAARRELSRPWLSELTALAVIVAVALFGILSP